MPDVLPTLGNTNWLLIVATEILEIGWMLLKTSTGGNPIWTTSSTSAGFDCKLNFVYIFCNLSRFISFSRLCPMGPAIFWRTGSTRLDSFHIESIMHLFDQEKIQWHGPSDPHAYSTRKKYHAIALCPVEAPLCNEYATNKFSKLIIFWETFSVKKSVFCSEASC